MIYKAENALSTDNMCTVLEVVDFNITFYLNYLNKGKKAKVWYLISAAYRCAVTLYNLESGSWLALAIVQRCKPAAPIARATDFGPAVETLDLQLCSQTYYAPVSHARPSPIIHVRNYMDYYSFTDPWGMDGWVGHVGWPIADGLTKKWSPIQLAVWRRIGKVRRPRPAF